MAVIDTDLTMQGEKIPAITTPPTIRYTIWQGPVCPIIPVVAGKGLICLHLDTGEGRRQFAIAPDWIQDDSHPVLQETVRQMAAFFSGRGTRFDLPLSPRGTAFQKTVWQALTEIPFGETRTYKAIAEAVGRPGAARAVGMANSRNPLPLLIPCHRVIGSSGKLTGFAHGLKMKETLLALERCNSSHVSVAGAPASTEDDTLMVNQG